MDLRTFLTKFPDSIHQSSLHRNISMSHLRQTSISSLIFMPLRYRSLHSSYVQTSYKLRCSRTSNCNRPFLKLPLRVPFHVPRIVSDRGYSSFRYLHFITVVTVTVCNLLRDDLGKGSRLMYIRLDLLPQSICTLFFTYLLSLESSVISKAWLRRHINAFAPRQSFFSRSGQPIRIQWISRTHHHTWGISRTRDSSPYVHVSCYSRVKGDNSWFSSNSEEYLVNLWLVWNLGAL